MKCFLFAIYFFKAATRTDTTHKFVKLLFWLRILLQHFMAGLFVF